MKKYVIMLADEIDANPDSYPIAEEAALQVLKKIKGLQRRVRTYYNKNEYREILLDQDRKFRIYEIVNDGTTEEGAIYELIEGRQ